MGETEIEPPPGFPADEAAAVFTAEKAGVLPEIAQTAYHGAVARGYKDSKGNVIRSWGSYVKFCSNVHQSIEKGKVAQAKANGQVRPGQHVLTAEDHKRGF